MRKSLKRLSIQTTDIYYCHRVDRKTLIEKTAEAMAQLKKWPLCWAPPLSTLADNDIYREGKIKYLGLSEVSTDTLRRACKVHHIDAVQIECSPFAILRTLTSVF